MAGHDASNPLDEGPEGGFTFSYATLLAFLGVAALALGAVFLLGSICAEHRIASVLATL